MGTRIQFEETMEGYLTPGEDDFENGFTNGQKKNLKCTIDVTITIDDIGQFIRLTDRRANLEGTVSCPGLGRDLKIIKGAFHLFILEGTGDPRRPQKRMVYEFHFKSETKEEYYFNGYKELYDETGTQDLTRDITTLFVKIYKGRSSDAPVYGSGIISFSLMDAPSLFLSLKASNTASEDEKLKAISQFLSFAFGEVLQIYFKNNLFFYQTRYENLVLSGRLNQEGESNQRDFFFFSGAHDLGFPWGDDQTFWDIVLVVAKPDGTYDRYLVADVKLDTMQIDIESGRYRYSGDMYHLTNGFQVSFLEDLKKAGQGAPLQKGTADFQIDFTAQGFDPVDLPFPHMEKYEIPVLGWIKERYNEWFPGLPLLGIHLGLHSVRIDSGIFNITSNGKEHKFSIDGKNTLGEAEISSFNNVKEPTMYYNYFCGINNKRDIIHVNIEADTWRNERIFPVKNMLDRFLSKMMRPAASVEMRIAGGQLDVQPGVPHSLTIKDENVLEINYDHYPTGVFQRRVVKVTDSTGIPFLALEEDMQHSNLASEPARHPVLTDSPLDQKESVVAVYKSRRNIYPAGLPEFDVKGFWDNLVDMVDIFHLFKEKVDEEKLKFWRTEEDHDKKNLLDKVIQATNFFEKLEKDRQKANKDKSEFSIVIKPNFMFLYHRDDRTTYTDPVLVKHLIDRIHGEGYKNICVVEAQSTYGSYFKNREVNKVAHYIGLEDCNKYTVVDLSEGDLEEPDPPFEGRLKGHRIHRRWIDADFRISFAKNKTHSYSYYTLTLKNIYGALPHQNKFKEYHCTLGIYSPTIEFIERFPIHFGFIDAYISADGPFGIFSDKKPNLTQTIIGGENSVAVDWIGASKMGLDPKISEYMKLAVERFGKPRIRLVGDIKEELYEPWENVPVELSFGAHHIIDRHYQFGNLLYSAFSHQDPKAFPRRQGDKWYITLIRFLTNPIRSMFFKRPVPLMKASLHESLQKMVYQMNPFDEPSDDSLSH
jgi:uncharacterized protein (DUF362 family)